MNRRDRELIRLAEIYVPIDMCIGGHYVHHTYCCSWCYSAETNKLCHKEKLRTKELILSDFRGEERKKISGYKIHTGL